MREPTLLPKSIFNTRGQIVGYYNDVEGSYHTKRDKLKGEMFLRKNNFSGIIKNNAIAIDTDILKRLLAIECKNVFVTIMNDKEYPYTIKITPKEIAEKGVKINFDKVNADGINTGFGEQYVFSITEDCSRLDINQKTLQ
jgi:hypothetical protein